MNLPENIFIASATDSPVFYADPSLENKTAGTSDLFLLIEKSAIQIALKERRSGSLIALEILPAKDKKQSGWKDLLENASSHSRILRNYEFLKVTAGIMSPEFTLVPEALFKAGDENLYFNQNFSPREDINIHARHVPFYHLYTVFSIDRDLENELKHLFQDPLLWHYSQALLSGLSITKSSDEGRQMWVNIRPNKLDMVVSENKKLLLLNSYSWQSNEDILYFILFVSEQLQLNLEKIPVSITGEIEESNALYQMFIKYARNVIIPDKPSSLSFAFTIENMPYHRYVMLYNLALCE